MHFLMILVLVAFSVTTARAQPSIYPKRLAIPSRDTFPTRALLATADGLTIVSRHDTSTVIWDAITKH